MSADLTRWNRAGLPRFRYVDGNAPVWLEELRRALVDRLPEPPAGWGGAPPPDEPESEWAARLTAQYEEAERADLAWEIVRGFARCTHILTEHLDAYANEGFLGTATQWESVRRLVAMLDVRPAPPASASTVLALEAKPARLGMVAKGFQVKHSPPDGGAPVIFETLEDLEIDAALNELRPLDHDRNPEIVYGSRIDLAGRVKGLKAGEPLVLEDERSGELHAYVILSVSEQDEITRVEVSPPVKSGIPSGYARIYAVPKERLEIVAPISRGAEVGRALQLSEEPEGLQPGDVVWISDGQQPAYRWVENVRGRRILLDLELGDLRVDRTVVGRPVVVPVSSIGGREVVKDAVGGLEATILAIKVSGDWSRLAGVWLADKVVRSGKRALPLFQAISADYRPVGAVLQGNTPDPNAGSTVLRLQWKHELGLGNPQALLAPPVGGGLWQADRYVEKTSGHLPSAITTVLPKKAAAGDVAVVGSGATLAWTRLAAVEGDADAKTAVLRASGAGWRDRGGSPYFVAETRVFTHFEASARLFGWRANRTPLPSLVFPPDLSAGLRAGRTVLVEVELENAPTAIVAARVTAVTEETVGGGIGGSIGGRASRVEIDRALPAGARYDNLVLRGNAVLSGHGEAKGERALGSGDASRSGQTFRFDEKGVSFVADPGQPSGVRAGIEVRVTGQGERLWQQVGTLADSGPADPHYTVRMTEDSGLELVFGDGRHGRRLPTGVNNVRLTWRWGTGLTGNVPAGSLVKPSRPHPLVEAVRQPLPATGGNDMEGVDSLRATAPASVSTLGRAVSLTDYGRLAASQSSVWQARAFAVRAGLARQDSVRLVVVPAGGGPLGSLEDSLRVFVQSHALPDVSVKVEAYKPKPVDLRLTLQIDTAQFDPERVVEAVKAQLSATFGLAGRKLGQALRPAEVFRIVEAVPGVANSECLLNGDDDPISALPDEVVHLDAPGSTVTVLYEKFEL